MKSTKLFLLTALIVSLLTSCSKQKEDYSLIPVEIDGKWGYINQKGKMVINLQFEGADFFCNGLARVMSPEGKMGYINKAGEYKIKAIYKDCTKFSDGLAFVVSEGGHPVCINTKGNTVFVLEEAQFVFSFKEGLALFCNKDKKYGFVDKSGKIKINAQFDRADSFNDGFAVILNTEGIFGYIDKSGKIVINPQFDYADDFSEGLAAVAIESSYDEKWGYIDKKGKYVINPQFDGAEPFSEGLAEVEQNGLYGFINTKGQFEINPQFELASGFKKGLAPVRQKNSWGFIDKKGKFVINPQFEAASYHFFGNIIPVKSGRKYGFIDKTGKYVVNPQFDEIMAISRGFYNYVKSDFYDASAFITKFFERASENSFDGINAITTLANMISMPQFKGKLFKGDKKDIIELRATERIDDISIKTQFHFVTPAWKTVSHYDNIFAYMFGEKTSDKIEFDYSAHPHLIEYQFSLYDQAEGKYSVIAQALKAEIERRYKVAIYERDYIWFPEDRDERDGYTYCLFSEFSGNEDGDFPTNFSFVITFDNKSISLFAGFFYDVPKMFYD